MVNVEKFREYIRESPEADNELVVFLNAAQICAENAGVREPNGPNELYELLIYMLASHWYENRGLVRQVSMNDIPFAATALIHQLRNMG